MDFSIFYRLRLKKIWWIDVIFYFSASLLVATILCYLVFLLKIYIQHEAIKDLDSKTETVGTDLQKDQEKTVFNYQKKINDYGMLLKNHKFASNVFSFLEKETLPNIWFYKFAMQESQYQIDVSGEAENMDALSRQTSAFEKNELVKKVSILDSNISELGKVNFNLSLSMNPEIFNYIPPPPPEENNESPEENNENPEPEKPNSEKLITSFAFPLSPEVVGVINQEDHTIALVVPQGTDVTLLSPRINLSPEASVIPVPDSTQDFTNPVLYTVTAQDGSNQVYTVSVLLEQPEAGEAKKSGATLIIIILSVIILAAAIGAGIYLFIRKKTKNKNKINVIQHGI